jgi:hypothetical protein
MFQNLISEKPGKSYDPNIAFKPKRSVYVHPFDAMSYVLLYYNALHLDTQPVVETEIMDLGG